MNASRMVDPAWIAPPGIWVQPIDGWGYLETIDGDLSGQFEIAVDEKAVEIGDGILGWRGQVITPGHKYAGLRFTMTPRHTTWTGVVVINVRDREKLVFSGMADTSGLECDW